MMLLTCYITCIIIIHGIFLPYGVFLRAWADSRQITPVSPTTHILLRWVYIEGSTVEYLDHFPYLGSTWVVSYLSISADIEVKFQNCIRQADNARPLRKRLQNSNQYTGPQCCYSRCPLMWLLNRSNNSNNTHS